MNRVDILADGDVVLAVGGSLELRVSSLVLKMTSPVFKAMLGPNFAEGHGLQSSSAASPPIVTLPDDDSEALKAVCMALHHQVHMVPQRLTHKTFWGVATVADKYGCVDAVKYAARAWAERIAVAEPREADDFESVSKLAKSAYILDLPSFFVICTEQLVKATRGRRMYVGGGDAIKRTILDAVEDTKSNVTSVIDERIDVLAKDTAAYLALQSKHYTVHDGIVVGRNVCEFTRIAATEYVQELVTSRLWPPQIRAWTIGGLFQEIENFSVPAGSSLHPCDDCEIEEGFMHLPSNVYSSFRRGIRDLKMMLAQLFVSVCLDCLQASGDEQRKCRTPHDGGFILLPAEDDELPRKPRRLRYGRPGARK